MDMWRRVKVKVTHLFLDETEWRSSSPMVASMGVEAVDSWNRKLVIGRGSDHRGVVRGGFRWVWSCSAVVGFVCFFIITFIVLYLYSVFDKYLAAVDQEWCELWDNENEIGTRRGARWNKQRK